MSLCQLQNLRNYLGLVMNRFKIGINASHDHVNIYET